MAIFSTTGSDTYPAGHVIKQSVSLDNDVASAISTTNSSYTDTGVQVVHTTAKSSADSYLVVEFYGGMDNTASDTYFFLDVLMRDSSSSSYDVAESLHKSNTYAAWYHEPDIATFYTAKYIRLFCGLVSEMGMPTTKSSWAAGDTLYFRFFYKVTGGTFVFAHGNSTYNFSVTEVSRRLKYLKNLMQYIL